MIFLGLIDLAGGLTFLARIYDLAVPGAAVIFLSALLLLKGGIFFLTSLDILSFFDLLTALFLLLTTFLTLPQFLLWVFATFLLLKGFLSFLRLG